MISKVTKDNKALYEDRIDQINKAFEKQGSSTRITSFESYFGNIEEIYALSTNFRGSAANDSNAGTPGKFLLLPLDEPLSYIDANKRTINIPADFNKNGIGVRQRARFTGVSNGITQRINEKVGQGTTP